MSLFLIFPFVYNAWELKQKSSYVLQIFLGSWILGSRRNLDSVSSRECSGSLLSHLRLGLVVPSLGQHYANGVLPHLCQCGVHVKLPLRGFLILLLPCYLFYRFPSWRSDLCLQEVTPCSVGHHLYKSTCWPHITMCHLHDYPFCVH